MGGAFPRLNDAKKARRLVVVFGDQLDASFGPLADLDKTRDVVLMMETDEEQRYVRSHKQRTALFFSAMRHFAADLADSGVRVRYVCANDRGNLQSFDEEVGRAIAKLRPESVHCVHPGEWRVLRTVEAWRDRVPVEIHEDEHFFTPIDRFQSWAEGRKQFTMEYFYREQRKRFDVLMDSDGKSPLGGAWNYDKDNREAFKVTPNPPKPYTPRLTEITKEVLDLVEARYPDNPGSIEGFRWPVTRDQARRALDDFIEHRLRLFGKYEDAMWTEQPFLYHSLLSPSGNLKLLNPRECVEEAERAYEDGVAPLNAVEGFVRQWLGWREFIRGVYWTQGPDYPNRNGLDQHGTLPDFFWTGDSDMACLADCVGVVIDHGFAHHVPRLMVMGNFAMLAGVHPREVADWYLAMFVDAVDWASNPNTIGMSQHADHGVVGTKPYAASGKYISRMSNYCEQCRYKISKRTGDDACPFNVFFWDFLFRHGDRFEGNNRMAMMLKNAERISSEERVEITSSAASLRGRLGV
ncbi:MAG: cryptochrome/photolyase family protein [Planctomycetota bacterium]